MGRPYEEVTFIVVHLGTGVSVGVHSNGKVTDVNDAMNEGTFSLDRAGGVPALSLIDMCYSGEFSHNEMLRRVNGSGGVYSYLGTKDMREVEARVSQGDEEALKIVEAFAYQIAKDIGAMAAVCRGKADLIIITGGMAHYRKFVDMIVSYVDFIAPIKIVPGEEEMGSLAEGAFRVLGGIENAKNYSEELQKFDGQLR
jgi:butyrate kinase